MRLWITDRLMCSEVSAHTARVVEGGWELSWLPGRVVSRDQAVTGMTLAQMAPGVGPGSRVGPHVRVWAAELGLSGPDAVALICAPVDEATVEAGRRRCEAVAVAEGDEDGLDP